jgi:hypothetical protein
MRHGIYDQQLADIDLFMSYLAIALKVTEKHAYPPVHVPEDLDGFDRIVWRWRSKEWRRQKAWRCWCKGKRAGRRIRDGPARITNATLAQPWVPIS